MKKVSWYLQVWVGHVGRSTGFVVLSKILLVVNILTCIKKTSVHSCEDQFACFEPEKHVAPLKSKLHGEVSPCRQ